MTRLTFAVLDARPEPYAVSPVLQFRVRVDESTGETVHAMAVRAQVRIDAQRRRYTEAEQEGVTDLFGEPERWGRTLKPLLWGCCSTTVQGFRGAREFDLPMSVTYDHEVAASKYLHALEDGEVPLCLSFAGTVFTRGDTGFAVEQISWEHDVDHRMPVAVWDELVHRHFPGSGWLRLQEETIAELRRFKKRRGLLGWDEVCAALLDEARDAAEVRS
ncbi:hypothetical protein EIL87_05960 [Saccharopolyspora rhizosphaerae]|uniref:Uncharacterized protein n=1 Tax=Saccharopolyspora rhizosphaerae TaxID=2492662 RepID=A0A3R8P805_9PSEU|nr:DUF6084 family protein [Saccharopolyspora rhizosphaerae]RRO18659.1 hypothetical protein EIL87_05960 [Saccharopolyspora rhizosphaerae]